MDKNINQQNFNEGTILHGVTSNKFTHEIKEYFIVEEKETMFKIRIKKSRMIELANMDEKEEEYSLLLNEGYKESGNMKAGAGKAVKIKRNEDSYECIFYEGEKGKDFDVKNIESKSFIKLNKSHLEAIFTFLRCNAKVEAKKLEEKRIERTTLELS